MNPDRIAKLKEFDAAEHLETPNDIALFLEAAFEDNNPAHIMNALGVVARSIGMTELAKNAGPIPFL